jgi:hypothetical protein
VDRYFVQNWPGLEKRVDKWRKVLPTLEIVGPIMSTIPLPQVSREGTVMIGFGGIDNPYVITGINSDYPFLMMKNIVPVLEEVKPKKVVVTGRGKILTELANRFPRKGFDYRMLSRPEMLSQLAQAQCFLTAPGLESMLDACLCQTPCFYLLPQNNSNLVQLKAYQEFGIGRYSIAFEDLFPEFTFERSDDQGMEMAKIMGYIKLLGNDHEDRTVIMQEKIRQFFQEKALWPELVDRQTRLFGSLGENGVYTIRKTILELMEKKRCSKNLLKPSLSI